MTRLTRFADSYRIRLVTGYVLVAAVFAASWAWSLYGPLTSAALRQQQRNLTAVAQAGALVASETSATPDALAKRLVARTDLRLTIVAADGTVLADSHSDPKTMANHSDRPEVISALAGEVGTARRVSRTEGVEELYVAVPAVLDGERVVLRVAQPLAEIEGVAARARRMGLLLLAVAMLIATAVAVRATASAARPIAALSRAAERMAAGDLGAPVPLVPSDLANLADALSSLRGEIRARIGALEAEQRTLTTVLDGLGDAVLLVEGEHVRYANHAACRLTRSLATGGQDLSLDDACVPAPVAETIREHRLDAEPFAVELEADPQGRTLRVLVVPLSRSAEHPRTLAVISDVTERARVDRVRRDFVANASHELKTPVAGIQLLAESADVAASDGDVEQSLAFTRQIEAEAARLKRLVTDLLDLSRLETVPAADTVTDLRVAIENTVLSHRSAAARKGLDLSADVIAVRGEHVFATADPTDVAVALDNLVDNAIAYTEAGGVKVSLSADAERVRVSVTDTGSGIPAEHLDRIFERFYRVDRARSRESGGTGLGLALVRHVVERNGGEVAVISREGAGTTFTVTFTRAS